MVNGSHAEADEHQVIEYCYLIVEDSAHSVAQRYQRPVARVIGVRLDRRNGREGRIGVTGLRRGIAQIDGVSSGRNHCGGINAVLVESFRSFLSR